MFERTRPRFLTRAAGIFVLCLFSFSMARAQSRDGGNEVYTTLGGVESGGLALRAFGPDLADAIVAPTGYNIILYGVTLKVKLQRRDLGSFDVFYSPINKSGQPYEVHVLATVSDSTLTRDFQLKFVESDPAPVLKQNTRYYVGIRKHAGALSTVILGNTVDPSVLNRPDVRGGAYSYDIKGQHMNDSGVYEMKVVMIGS